MDTENWLTDTRTSYDTVATSYAEIQRESLANAPLIRATLGLFADLATGPIADVGCGPGSLTALLCERGLDAFGIDLSPGMIALARRTYPGSRFAVGSMTDLPVAAGSLGAILAFFSVIHIPDADVPRVCTQFRNALRPGGIAMIGFHTGDRHTFKTEGYGGHPMRLHVYRRPMARMAAWLRDAGFTIDAETVLDPDTEVPGGIIIVHRGP